MKAKSISGKDSNELKLALSIAMDDGFRPSLAMVLMPSQIDHKEIVQVLREREIAIFGAYPPGMFSEEGIKDEQVVVMLMDLNPEYFRIVLEEVESESFEQTIAKTQLIAKAGQNFFDQPAYILSAASFQDTPGEALVEGITSVAGKNARLIGGIAGGKPIQDDCLVFTEKQESQRGIICLILDMDRIEIADLAVSGWRAVGTPKTVTQSDGSWIYTIDDQPALDVLRKFTGLEVNMEDQKDIFHQIGVTYPLQVIQANGDPLMNPPLLFNRETGAVQCGGHVPQGSQVRFSLPPDFDIVQAVIESAREAQKKSLPEAEALMVFSCIGRLANLGPLVEEEILGIQAVWDLPLIGFFSCGEFGTPTGGHAAFHGVTCSWLALKEKE
ncbi:MAG: FIST C-terminal domain-containing protein [Bacteroidia bacterium]|nr:FIST C-terminal domain-containing protein [Bacteroidia bacterium]